MRHLALVVAAAVTTAACGTLAACGTPAPLPSSLPSPDAGAAPAVLYVSPSGSDANPGSQAAPVRTPQAAVNKLPAAGGTVQLAAGTYAKQRIVLTNRHDVTVRAAAGARPVLNATGLTSADDLSGVIEIRNGSHVTVDGLTVTGYRTSSVRKTPVGVYVTGAGSGITVTRTRVTALGNDNATKGSMEINAHGIAVYGTNPTTPLTDVHIDGNEVDHVKLGASEAVVVNGNVDGWTVSHNFVHDNDNIGIDAIGYEETIGGTARYTDVNRARHGSIVGNAVARISADGNPAYYEDGEYCRCADGIYVDGGTSIVIADNTVTASDIGIEVAAENPKGKTNAITVRGNTVTGSHYVGMTVGGYAPNRGEAYDLTISGNTLRGNTTPQSGSPELLLQYKVHQATITGNRITSTDSADPVLVQRVPAAGTAAQNAGVALDRNDYGAPVPSGDAEFGWFATDATITGFAAWQRTSGQDAHSTYTRR